MMRKVRFTFLIIMVLLSLVACGRNRDTQSTEEPAATEEAAPTPADDVPDQPASPLDQPESPLPSAAESPLPAPEPVEEATQDSDPAAEQGNASTADEFNLLADFDAIMALAEETVPGAPEPGAAALSGVVYSYGTGTVVPGTVFYLSPAVETENGLAPRMLFVGADEESGDIRGTTGEDGEVDLTNVPPGNYYMVVWTVYNWLLAEAEEGNNDPLLITVEENDQLDLDLIYVNWP